MKYSSRLHLTTAAAAVLAALAASASTAAMAAEDTVSTETVKVTAARVEQEIQEVPMSLSVVTEDDVKHANAKTLADLLQDIPGVQVTNAGSQGLKRISIRGEDTFRTLVMINGQKISEQKSMDGSPILIDPAAIERIEVIKGPASVLYGSDAIGGAINIITKKGGKKAFEADASVAWNGAGHGWSESLMLSGSANRFHYRLSGNYQSQEDLDTPEGRLPHTAFRTKSAGAALSYDITDNITAGIQADIFDSHLRSGSITYDPEDFYVDIPKWKREKVGVFVDAKNINDTLTRVRWDAFWQKTQKQMTNHVHSVDNESGSVTVGDSTYNYTSASTTLNNNADNRLTTLGTSLQLDWQLGENHYLVTGYEFSQDSMKADTINDINVMMTMASGRDFLVTPYSTRYNEGKQSTHSVFAAFESTLPADFIANYGVRYTYVDSKMTHADSYSLAKGGVYPGVTVPPNPMMPDGAYYPWPMFSEEEFNDGSAGNTGSTHNSRAVFNAGLTWTGIEDLALRATWSQGFRAPLLQEQYLVNSMGGGTIYGNPSLKPEKSNNFELGARYNHGALNVDATAFLSLATDYITKELLNSEKNESRYINADKAKTFGFELTSSLTLADHYTPYFSVTVMRRKLESSGTRNIGTKDDPIYEQGQFSTSDSGTPALFARYGLKTNHELFGGVLTTDTYARSQTATKTYSYSTDETTRIAGFTTFNFGAGYRFGKDGNYTVDAEFLNIFNQTYQYNTSSYEAGRSFNVKLTAHY